MKTSLDIPKGHRALIVLAALVGIAAHAGPPSSRGRSATTGPAPDPRLEAPSSNDGPPISPAPAGPPLANSLLAWDAEVQEAKVQFGTGQTAFSFQVTNVSQERIIVTGVRASCGCTVPKLPALPWTLDPGSKGTIEVEMNLAGKQGILSKPLTVLTDHGFKVLQVRATVIGSPKEMGPADRARNLQIATANRQAVFQGQCAACHATPALGKTGAGLYQTACTICHDTEHRAACVPDLRQLQKPTYSAYWRTWITSSAEGKLMPAFATEHGGILTAAQIDSLVAYLVETIPSGNQPSSAPLPLLVR